MQMNDYDWFDHYDAEKNGVPEITSEEIAAADLVILAIDVKIADRERFEGKKIIQVSTDVAIKSPNKLMEKAKEVIAAA